MATLIPQTQSSNVEATYEDMFKEITRKLYGEETGNGLHTLGTPVAQVATSGPTAAPEGEQRSFTNLQQIDRQTAPTIEYEQHNAAAAAAAAAAGNNVVTTTAAVAAAAAAAAAAANAQQQNVIIQQQQQQQQGEGNTVVVSTQGGAAGNTGNAAFKSEDHLSTAFGLAALMQNGFAQAATNSGGGTILNKVVTNTQQQQNTADSQQQRWSNDGSAVDQQQQQQQPQIVQWTTGGKLQSYAAATSQQQQQQQQVTTPKSKNKNRQDPHNNGDLLYASPSTSSAQNLVQTTPTSNVTNVPNTGSSGGSASSSGGSGGGSRKKSNNSHNQQQQAATNGGVQIVKRYACTHCPYSTDRRDLYTRHENIHKDEKPFQCYACMKQFNRADHVKKHFLRMHREMQYDINKTRRHVPNSGSTSHSGGRGNVTISGAANVTIDNAFLESQRQPTSSSLSIVETIEAVASAADEPLPQLKQEKLDDNGVILPLVNNGGNNVGAGAGGNVKPKREKRFTCCYCPWSGADKWGLKRHLNTHTKPFVCLLCDYKAARSERLATHVLKVHNKRACNKCSYLADTQEEYQAHLSEVHPHDNRPSRNNNNNNANNNSTNNANNGANNLNVLRTIGNTLVTNNQLNTFQNTGNAFGNTTTTTTTNTVGNAGGSVTIYTTTTTNDGVGGTGGGGNITGGPLQEIIVNPTSMVGWRLSANGSLIPPHDLLTGSLPNAAAQKRGSERLFQYLEADGSDPEDYARLLKMDAISRNTASVAQDFHKAGGVHELKLPANHQLLFNNKLPTSQWTTREAAALLHSLSNMSKNTNPNSYQNELQLQQQQQRVKFGMRVRQHSTGEDDENTPSSGSSSSTSSNSSSGDECTSPMKQQFGKKQQKQAHVAATTLTIPTGIAITTATTATQDQQQQHKAMTTIATAFLEAAYEQNAIELLANKRNKYHPHKIQTHHHQQHHHHQQQQQYTQRDDGNDDNDDDVELENDEDQENQVQLIKSPPANKLNLNHNYSNNNSNLQRINKIHRNAVGNTNTTTTIQHNNISSRHLDNKENNTTSTATPTTSINTSNSGGATPFLTQMEYQNLNKIGTQFQNYVKDIISKYYAAETPPLLLPALPTPTTTAQQSQSELSSTTATANTTTTTTTKLQTKRKRMLSETEEYIEYLRNKEDITLTITPKTPQPATQPLLHAKRDTAAAQSMLKRQQDLHAPQRRQSPKKLQHMTMGKSDIEHLGSDTQTNNSSRKSLNQLATLLPLLADAASKQQYLSTPLDFSKKPTKTTAATTHDEHSAQSADKRSSRKQAQPKKIRISPEAVIAMLRDKHLNRMVHRKLSCISCANSQRRTMLIFSYHTKGSLALHRYWKHGGANVSFDCRLCGAQFKQRYSLTVHNRRRHPRCDGQRLQRVAKRVKATRC